MTVTNEMYQALSAEVQALRGAMDDLSRAVETISGSLAAQIVLVNERFEKADEAEAGLEERLTSICDALDNCRGDVGGFAVDDLAEGETETDERRATRMGLLERVTELETLVRGRNRSAPVKRNMTDDDAVRCLKGDAAEMDHKEAGEFLGLTYAQVYSCRLEYTFKHVHKGLKESGWKNPFVKK